MSSPDNETRRNAFSRILGKLAGIVARKSDDSDIAVAAADMTQETEIEKSVRALDDLLGEKTRLQGVLDGEIRKKESLDEQIQTLESQRIDALTAHRISDDEKDRQRAEELLKQIEQLKQDMADASAIANSIKGKTSALQEKIGSATHEYRIHLGKLFDEQMDLLVEEYNDIASKFARVTIDIDAIYRLMINCGCGNSNGWWRDARAPTIKPRDGRIYPPIMDTTSRDFDAAARARVSELSTMFKEAGFMWQFDRAPR